MNWLDSLRFDDLDGDVTMFTSTDEGTETVAVFDQDQGSVVVHLVQAVQRLRKDVAYAASLIQCRIEGDDLSSSDIRDYLLHAVGMTIEEAMATTDLNLWGEEE